MTYTLRPESPYREAARQFALAFRRALEERGVSKRGLAARLTGNGSSRSSIQLWVKGESLPTVETARRLDAVLGTVHLEGIVARSRIVKCENRCGATVIVRGNQARTRYCSQACARQAAKVRSALLPKRDTLARRLELHRRAVAAFCAACQPDGICRAPECELRSVSPLPLAAR